MTYVDGLNYRTFSPVLRFIFLSGTTWVLSTSVVLGAAISSRSTYLDSQKSENIDTHLFAQASTNTSNTKIITITNIKVNSTDKGLELILQTSQGRQLKVTNNSKGKNFIADIKNAQLSLSNNSEFTEEKPVAGITKITVTNKDENTIRITVTGEKGIPKAELFDSNQGLIFGFTPVASTTEPSTTSPEGTQQEQASEEQPPAATEKKPEETPQSSKQNEDVIELIVTAQKRAENLQDVPISITVLDRDQLESGDVQSFEEVAKNTPNFSVFGSGTNRLSTFYSVRGITNFNAFSRDGVGIFIDDVPYDFAGFQNLGFNDLERVEILRGPQNTLYGRSSLGGVINVVTRQPTNKFEFKNSISYGNFDDFKAQASISGPLVEDKLFFRLSGDYSTRDGYVRNTFLDRDVDGGSGGNGRVKLLWTPSADWEVSFNASFDDYREGAAPYVLLNQSDPSETELDFNGFNDIVNNAQSLKIAYNQSDFRFTSITTNRFSSQKAAYDIDSTTSDIQINAPDFQSRLFSQEFRFQSPEEADKLQWIFGGYFESSKFENNRPFIYGADFPALGFPFPPTAGVETNDVESNTKTYAVFSQIDYKPIERLTLTAGLRYEATNSEIDATQTFTSTDGSLVIPLLSVQDLEKNGDAVLPRFVAEYKLTPNLMTYGSISRGYRPAGASFQPISEDAAVFDAETSWNYEVGLKSSWLDNKLNINLALFHNKVDNFQFVGIDQGNVFIDNADVKVTGAELEVRATPVKGLDIIGGLGFVNSRFRNGNDPFTGESLEDKRTTFSPDLTYNLAVQYRSVGGLFGRVELVGFGTTYFDDLNTIKQDPYALVNVRAGYEFKNKGIYLFANNIFDTEYVTQAFNNITGLQGTYGAPSTYGIQLKSRF